jgi:hypothetical protein
MEYYQNLPTGSRIILFEQAEGQTDARKYWHDEANNLC